MEDIKIIGVDKDATGKASGELYDVVFNLSEAPDWEWTYLFDDIWRHRTSYSMKRSASIIGTNLVITCALEEVEPSHLPELKKAVERTNTEMRERQVSSKEKLDRQLKQAREDRRRIEQALDKLTFDQ